MELACVVPQGVESGEFLQLLPFDFVSLDWSERSQRTIAQWEQKSSTIYVYQPFLIPGLLQSPEFATEVLRSAGITGEAFLSRFGSVSCRTLRNALDGRLPVELFAVGFLRVIRTPKPVPAPVPMRRRMAAPWSFHVARALTWDRNLPIPYPDCA
jgi:hypothetical protein